MSKPNTDLQAMLNEFIKKFDLPKGAWTDAFMYERISMMQEELNETAFAATQNRKVDFLDGLVDLVYFAIGTARLLDLDFNEAFRRVHAANMKKVRAYTERSAVDLVKPVGWVKPNLEDLV